jgi:hypothetical protein
LCAWCELLFTRIGRALPRAVDARARDKGRTILAEHFYDADVAIFALWGVWFDVCRSCVLRRFSVLWGLCIFWRLSVGNSRIGRRRIRHGCVFWRLSIARLRVCRDDVFRIGHARIARLACIARLGVSGPVGRILARVHRDLGWRCCRAAASEAEKSREE